MCLYTIYYEFLDKRGYTRSKKILCNGKDRTRDKCLELKKLTKHRPISNPIIFETIDVNQYGDIIDYNELMRGDIYDKISK